MTKITNSDKSRKSQTECETQIRQTRTPGYTRGGIIKFAAVINLSEARIMFLTNEKIQQLTITSKDASTDKYGWSKGQFESVLKCTNVEKRILLNDPGIFEQRLNNLERKVQNLETENLNLKNQLNQQAQVKAGLGAVYVRWGKKDCPANVSNIVYTGFAAGGWYNNEGSASNYICLPADPIDSGLTPPDYSRMYGVEYETSFWKAGAGNEDAPCSVCISFLGTNALMIPGRNECYSGWTKQYDGFLGSSHTSHKAQTEFVCVDGDPDYLNAGLADQDGALFYPVNYRCGTLQCPPYVPNHAANCVVCVK